MLSISFIIKHTGRKPSGKIVLAQRSLPTFPVGFPEATYFTAVFSDVDSWQFLWSVGNFRHSVPQRMRPLMLSNHVATERFFFFNFHWYHRLTRAVARILAGRSEAWVRVDHPPPLSRKPRVIERCGKRHSIFWNNSVGCYLIIFPLRSIASSPEVIKGQTYQNSMFLWKCDIISETVIGTRLR